MTTRTALSGSTIFAGLLCATGLAVVVRSAAYGMSADQRLGPGAFPGALGAILTGLGAILVVQERRREVAPVAEAGQSDEVANGRKAFLVLGMLAAAVAVAPWVGLVPALLIFLFTVAFVVEKVGLVRSTALAMVCFALYYGVFELLLGVPMPGPF